ncbi:hypothetical protein [Amycolatopsis sp. NPDC051716]|uniref:hypothetical protein n=1 Tax=Amycolatopsis sp. NPDC051716 TaxID=3155804 RepID=UPI0034369DDE
MTSTADIVKHLRAVSRGTELLASDIERGRRSVKTELQYVGALAELSNVLRVHAYMYDEQENPSAPVVDISPRLADATLAGSDELALFTGLLYEVRTLAHRFSQRFADYQRQPRPEPPHDPPPLSA